MGLKVTADYRLKLLIEIKKNVKDSNFIAKEEFSKVYGHVRRLLDITGEMETEHLQKVREQMITKKRLFSRRIDTRSQRKPSHSDFIDSEQKLSYKRKSPERLKTDKSYTENAIEKMRIKVLNWEHLSRIKEGNVFKNILTPEVHFNDEADEDSYYLQEFYKSTAVKNIQKSVLQNGKTILPSLRGPAKKHH